jgi:ABC-2 type transport system permease protein
MIPFLKKEILEQFRRKRVLLLGILFAAFALLGVATAKLMPAIMEMFADEIAASGMTIDIKESTIMDAWTQFFKNASIPLIVVIILWSGSFTGEYQKHTLIPLVTKGLSRTGIFVSKMITAVLVWTAGFALYFGILYGYAEFYWGNGTVKHIGLAVTLYWLYGVWLLAILGLFSAIAETTMQVLLGVGGVFFLVTFLELVPKLPAKLPTALTGGLSLLQGSAKPSDFTTPVVIVLICIVLCLAVGVVLIRKKKL